MCPAGEASGEGVELVQLLNPTGLALADYSWGLEGDRTRSHWWGRRLRERGVRMGLIWIKGWNWG